MRRQRPKTLLACGIVVALAFSISNARVAHAQWYYQAAKYIGIGVGTIITLWEATSEACSIYEGNTNNPSGRTLAACRRAGANKNSLPDQLDAIRALPKAQRDEALGNYCHWISDSDKRILMEKLRPDEKTICDG